jgi:hypothetical protein
MNWDWLTGSQSKMKQVPTMNPDQQQYMQQLFSGLQGQGSNIPGMEYLQSLFSDNPEAFNEFQAPAMRQFNEQIMPGIAERFSGMGAGSRNSSAFNNAGAMAGARLSENLSAQRAGLRSGAMNQLQGFGQMGMRPSFENVYMQGQPGLLQGIAGGAGQMGGMMGILKMMTSMGLM